MNVSGMSTHGIAMSGAEKSGSGYPKSIRFVNLMVSKRPTLVTKNRTVPLRTLSTWKTRSTPSVRLPSMSASLILLVMSKGSWTEKIALMYNEDTLTEPSS